MEKDINNFHNGNWGMLSLTIDSLGDKGNKIMHLGEGLLLFSGVITAYQVNRKNNRVQLSGALLKDR